MTHSWGSGLLCRIAALVVAATIVSLEAKAAVQGTLRVTSFPPGAEVWIDGALTGKTTPATLFVATGEHQVAVKAPGGGWQAAQQVIVVERGLNVVSLTLVPAGVQGPQGPPGPPGAGIPENARVEVDCAAGQQIRPALSTLALNLTIVLRGTCEESVMIMRDNVTLRGGEPGAGLRASSPEQTLLQVWGARAVNLSNLTLQGGRVGLSVSAGAFVSVASLDISGADFGVQMSNARGSFHECKIHDNVNDGFNQHLGASAYLQNSEVYNNGTGVSMSGGEFSTYGATIRDNSWVGVWAFGGSNIRVEQSTVTRNANEGLFLTGGSAATVRRSRILANGSDGIGLMDGSVVGLFEEAVVEENSNSGVSASGTSSVMNNGSVVQSNHRNGVHLSDVAQLFINWNGSIQNNEGWGVYCNPVPDVAGIHGSFGPDPTTVIGPNVLGRISCPGLTLP